MPLSEPVSRTPLHDRDILCRGFEREDGLFDIEGFLCDRKHYAFENRARGRVKSGESVHEMRLRITIDEDLLIHAVEAVTDAAPFPVCPEIASRFQALVGHRIGPGWSRVVKQHLGGLKGCTHLVELLRPLATTAYQTLTKVRRLRDSRQTSTKKRPAIIDTCHAFAADGAVVRLEWPDHYTGAME